MIAIRQAGEGDLAVVARLFRSVQALHAEHHPEKFFPPAENDTPTEAELAWVRELVTAPATQILLAELEGQAAGCAVVQEVNREASVVKRSLRYLLVDHIGVETRFQGAGGRHGAPRSRLSPDRPAGPPARRTQRLAIQRKGPPLLRSARLRPAARAHGVRRAGDLDSVTPRTRSEPNPDGQ